ncbi:MAG TPA: isocitrate/isopropylmalate family dehydrogenase, partial [Dehalococcoidia bacterium]
MMLRLSLGLEAEAQTVEKAVDSALQQNLRTPDIAQEGTTMVNTSQMGDAVAKAVLAP